MSAGLYLFNVAGGHTLRGFRQLLNAIAVQVLCISAAMAGRGSGSGHEEGKKEGCGEKARCLLTYFAHTSLRASAFGKGN